MSENNDDIASGAHTASNALPQAVKKARETANIYQILIPCIGFALLRLWTMSIEEQGIVFPDNHLASITSHLVRGGFPLLMVVAFGGRELSPNAKRISIIVGATLMAIFGPATILGAYESSGYLSLFSLAVGMCGFGWLYVSWAETYRYVKIKDVAVSLFTSLIISSTLSLLLSYLPMPATLFCLVAIPLVTVWLFFLHAKHEVRDGSRPDFTGFYDGQMISLTGKWFAMLIFYSAVIGAMHIISSNQPSLYSQEVLYTIYCITGIVFAGVIVISLAATNRLFSLDAFWIVIIVAICASLILAIANDGILQIVLSIFAGIRYVAFAFINIKLIDIAHHSRKPLHVIFAFGWGMTTLFMAVGKLIALYCLESLGMSINIVVAALIAVLIMGTLLLFSNSSLSDIFVGKDVSPSGSGSDGDGYEEKSIEALLLADCRRLQQEHGLTEREIQVVLLIAQGHTQAYCADSLVVSINTIRGHMKRIYTKLGIHSKEELLELLASEPKA